jgi:hypothetical protein
MAFDPVLTGATANDGTGDPLRTAFTRINDNFDLAVEGAASSTDGTVVQFDGTTGKVVKASSVVVADIIVEGDARLTDSRTPTAHGNEAHTSTFVDAAGAAAAAPVQSVNTLTGAVVLDAAAVGADPTGTAASEVSTHTAVTTSVHGIADTATLVVGPASATTDAVAVFADTTGKLLKDGTGTVTAGKFSPTATTVAGNGVYLPATNAVAISTAGVERLRVLATGNVGIGTATPARLLDVATDAAIHGVRVGRGAGDITSNTAVGALALNANTTGSVSSAFGINSLASSTTGIGNSAFGRQTLQNNTTGNSNVAIGVNALLQNTVSSNNTANGTESLQRFRSTNGQQTAVGFQSLYGGSATATDNTGGENTAVGHQAGDGITTGSTNTIVGHNAGRSITTGSGNTVLGAGLAGEAALANTVLIGSSGAERMRIDSSGNVGVATTSPTAPLDVNGNTIRVRTARTPASAAATGNAGDIAWDSDYIYVCVATDTWKRVAIATWP